MEPGLSERMGVICEERRIMDKKTAKVKYDKDMSKLWEERKYLNRGDFGCYVENHHIVPESCGGGNEPENLVYVTAEEHYEAHRDLYYLTVGIKDHKPMTEAFNLMSNILSDKPFVNKEEYAKIRKELNEIHTGEGNPFFGKKHKPETIDRFRELAKNRSPEHRKKIGDAQKGKIISAETRAKLSVANRGENNPNFGKVGAMTGRLGEDHPMFGYKYTDEQKEEKRKQMQDEVTGRKRDEKGRLLSKNSPLEGYDASWKKEDVIEAMRNGCDTNKQIQQFTGLKSRNVTGILQKLQRDNKVYNDKSRFSSEPSQLRNFGNNPVRWFLRRK